MKKLVSIVTLIIVLLYCENVYAFTYLDADKKNEVTFDVSFFDSKDEFDVYLEELDSRSSWKKENVSEKDRDFLSSTSVHAAIIRCGLAANDCELYLYWEGTDLYNQ